MERLYLDANAGVPLRPEARRALVDALSTVGNASSVHAEGREARRRVEAARAAVADLVAGDARNVTFTSGGTEANNTVLTDAWRVGDEERVFDTLLVAATEHPSVLAGGRFARHKVRRLPVDRNGILDLEAFRHALHGAAPGRALVSIMLANNETGVIQPIPEIAAIAHAAEAVVHTDAVQAVGRVTVDIEALAVDVLTLSAHKIGGPQGAGAIVRRRSDVTFAPLLTGGGQETRLRGGTENVAAIAGFGAAARAALSDLDRAAAWLQWRDAIAGIITGSGIAATIFGAGAPRLPQTLCIGVDGVAAETLVIALDLEGVAVSSGAACSSGKVAPSHVLAAMGVPPEAARSAIRISLGWQSSESVLDCFSSAWHHVLRHVAPERPQAAEAAE